MKGSNRRTGDDGLKSVEELLQEAQYCVDCAAQGWEVSGHVFDAIQLLRLVQARIYAESKPNR